MKKFLSLAFVLMLAASTAMAAEKGKTSAKKVEKSSTSSSADQSSLVIQFQGDLGFLVTDTSDSVTYTGLGFGVEASAAYAFNKNFSLGLMTGLHGYDLDGSLIPGSTGSWSYAPIEIVAQYSFGGDGIRPYVLFGVGLAATTLTIDSDTTDVNQGFSEVDAIVSPGIGVAFDLSDKASFFVQTRLDVTFQTQDWKDFLSAGGDLGDGMFLPIQVGVNFSAN